MAIVIHCPHIENSAIITNRVIHSYTGGELCNNEQLCNLLVHRGENPAIMSNDVIHWLQEVMKGSVQTLFCS